MKRAMKLRTWVALLQSVIMLVIIVGTGVTVAVIQNMQLRSDYQNRMLVLANSVARLDSVIDAFDQQDPSVVIQPLAELVREAAGVTYVVVSNTDGIRYSHPNPELIGQPVSTKPTAAETGKVFTGSEVGTLGESWRVKVPIRTSDGDVIGQVSVGTLESKLAEENLGNIVPLAIALGIAAVLGVILSTGVGHLVRRRTYGVEPDEIKAMLDTRDATLHGIGDGIIVLDKDNRIALCNDAGLRLLSRTADTSPVGEEMTDVLAVDMNLLLEHSGHQQLALAGERILLARADPVLVSGRQVGIVIILMDRTELDSAMRQLAGAQSVAEALRSQQHEFANVLHTLGGLLELGEVEAAGRVIERAGAGTGGAMTTTGGESAVRDIEIAALLLAKRSWAREHSVNLVVDPTARLNPPTAELAATGDRVTIMGNLIDNAIEAAGSGGSVHIQLSDDGTESTFVVEDDGPGIPADQRDSVFALTHTSKGTPNGLPRGYGLTLVRRVVDRLNGSVTIDTSPMGGARFTVTLLLKTPVETPS